MTRNFKHNHGAARPSWSLLLRFRPILTTTIAAMLGAVPLMLGNGAPITGIGAETGGAVATDSHSPSFPVTSTTTTNVISLLGF